MFAARPVTSRTVLAGGSDSDYATGMVSFSDVQLAAVMAAAEPIQPELRMRFVYDAAIAFQVTGTEDCAALVAAIQRGYLVLAGYGPCSDEGDQAGVDVAAE
jgi:hypothetical protein